MSVPRVPGYNTAIGQRSLAEEWLKPEGSFPAQLWPYAHLRTISPTPTEWLTIEHWFFSDSGHGGVACVLAEASDVSSVLERDEWIGHDLGSVSVWQDGRIDDGLTTVERGVDVQFFCRVRPHHGLRLPSVDFSQPFLWYWDAIPTETGWKYVNAAGRDEELVKFEVSEGYHKVEVRALELRQYLAVRNLALIVQHDYTWMAEPSHFDRVDASHHTDWCNFTWHCVSDVMPDRDLSDLARIVGQFVIKPALGAKLPRWEERSLERTYPSFQYGVDPTDGSPLLHSCNPEVLGSYFDEDDTLLHYLTPVYFRPEVLGRYINEPSRYSVNASSLSCLDLWVVDISINTAGLVEVYLGDLGQKVPGPELPHWLGHNVAPAGRMIEARYRRDFLNQPTAQDDPPGELKRSREAALEATTRLFGSPLWKPLEGSSRSEFDHVFTPVSSDPYALKSPVIILTTTLVDSLDVKVMRDFLGGGDSELSKLKPLQLLERLVVELGGDRVIHRAFHDLHTLRSSGGIAHRGGTEQDKVLDRLGLAGMNPPAAFNAIARRLAVAMRQLTELIGGYESSST